MVTYDSRVFFGSSGEAAMLNRDARARRQAPPRATLRRSLGLIGGNCAGRRLDSTTKEEATGRRRAGKRRIELSLNENFCFSDQHRKLRGAFILSFGTGEKGNRLELSVNESKCECAGRASQGDEAAMENHSRRTTHAETHDPYAHRHHESSDRLFSWFFYEAVVQHMLLTSLIFVELVELYTFHGKRPPAIFNFQARTS